MTIIASKKDMISSMAIIIFSIISAGIHGLISITLLISISQLDFGRDSVQKHGVSSGASRLGGIAIFFSLTIGLIFNYYLSNNSSLENISYYFDQLAVSLIEF